MEVKSTDRNSPDSKRQKLSENATDKVPFELLCDIIKAGDSQQLRDKLSEGIMPDLNTCDENKRHGSTLLMIASEGGQIECVKVLLEFGALVDLPRTGTEEGDGEGDDDDWFHRSNAIYEATKKGYFDIVKLLLETDPNARLNYPLCRPLYEACRQGHLELAKLLVEHGAELQDDLWDYGTNTLMEATKSGNAELVEYLISKGADVNYENEHNPHALLTACRGRYLDVMEVLLKHGAYVDITEGRNVSYEENTCLNIACKRGDLR